METDAHVVENRTASAILVEGIFTITKWLNTALSSEQLRAAFNNHALSGTIAFEWFDEFRCDQRSLNDKPGNGLPVGVTIQDPVVDVVGAVVKEDVRMTHDTVRGSYPDSSKQSCLRSLSLPILDTS